MGRRLHRSSKRYVLISKKPPSCYATSGILHHDYLEPRSALATALRDCGHSLREVGRRLEEARKPLHEAKGFSWPSRPRHGVNTAGGVPYSGVRSVVGRCDARKIFARFTACCMRTGGSRPPLSTLRRRICCLGRWRMKTSLWMSLSKETVRQIIFG